jgi:hypothetical protein
MIDEGYRAALSYFRAVETDPMTDEADRLAGDLLEEWCEEEIMTGLALVAAFLRDALRGHAERLGCTCGSVEWLDEAIAHPAMGEHTDA